jgi:hypothetical protein
MKDRQYKLSDRDVERLQTVTFGQLHQDFSVDEAVLTARLIKLCNRYNTACEIYANGGFLGKWSKQAEDMEHTVDGRRILSENSDKAKAERDSLPIKMQKLIDKEDADEHGQNRDRFHIVESGMYAYITFNGDRIPWQS